jgi:hypothetical protein
MLETRADSVMHSAISRHLNPKSQGNGRHDDMTSMVILQQVVTRRTSMN